MPVADMLEKSLLSVIKTAFIGV